MTEHTTPEQRAELARLVSGTWIVPSGKSDDIRFLRNAVPALLAEMAAAEAERDELNGTFDLQWKADMRAVTQWREGHPGRELTLPGRTDMVVWLLERWDTLRARVAELEAMLPHEEGDHA